MPLRMGVGDEPGDRLLAVQTGLGSEQLMGRIWSLNISCRTVACSWEAVRQRYGDQQAEASGGGSLLPSLIGGLDMEITPRAALVPHQKIFAQSRRPRLLVSMVINFSDFAWSSGPVSSHSSPHWTLRKPIHAQLGRDNDNAIMRAVPPAANGPL